MCEVVELRIPARPEYLALARVLVAAAAASDPSFPDDRIDDLRLAVSEACTNAIEAQLATRADGAEPLDPDEPIIIRCELVTDGVAVEVRDHGQGFDPDAIDSHPAVTDPRRLDYERGLGIPLIRVLADQVEFRPTPNGTTVVMVLNATSKPENF